MTKRLKVDCDRDNTAPQTNTMMDKTVVIGSSSSSSVDPSVICLEEHESSRSGMILNGETSEETAMRQSITVPSHKVQENVVMGPQFTSPSMTQLAYKNPGGQYQQSAHHVRLPGFDHFLRYPMIRPAPVFNYYNNNCSMSPPQQQGQDIFDQSQSDLNVPSPVSALREPKVDLVSQSHELVHQVLHTLRSPGRTAQQRQHQQLSQILTSNPQLTPTFIRKRRSSQEASPLDGPYTYHYHPQGPGPQNMKPSTMNCQQRQQQHGPSQEGTGHENVGMMMGPPQLPHQTAPFTADQQLRQQSRRLRRLQHQLFQLRRQQMVVLVAGGQGQSQVVSGGSVSGGDLPLDNSLQMYIAIFSELNTIVTKIMDSIKLLPTVYHY